MLDYFNNWDIITFSHPATTSEYFEEIHQVVLGGNSKNIARLFQHSKCSTTNTTGTPTMVYYVIKFVSEAYTLQDENTRDGKKSSSDELVVNTQYLRCIQEKTNYNWEQKEHQQIKVFPTSTIVHPSLDVAAVREVHAIPRSFCN